MVRGVKNPFQNEAVKLKCRETKKKLYENETYNNRSKAMQTNIDRYGETTYIHSKEGKEELKRIFRERYGCDHHWKNEDVQNKRQKTIIENNGGMGMASPNIAKKVKQTLLEISGYEHNWSDPKCREVCYQTCEELYGLKYPVLLHPPNSSSKGEIEVRKFVESIYAGKVEYNNRKKLNGWELDIWLPELNKAIEYDGTYWHSSKQAKVRDEYKNKLCKENNIDLLRIKEKDWKNNRDLIREEITKWINKS